MKFEGYKISFITLMISFSLFLLSWKCYIVNPYRYSVPKYELLISKFALKSKFDSIALSIFLGFVLPFLLIISTKVYLIKKSNRKGKLKR